MTADSRGTTTNALPGWLALPFLLLASVCGAAPERGREASLELQRLGRGSVYVSGELLDVDARRNLAFEHATNGRPDAIAALAKRAGEMWGEGAIR